MKFNKLYPLLFIILVSGCGKKDEPKVSEQQNSKEQNQVISKPDSASNEYSHSSGGERGNGKNELDKKILDDANGQWVTALIDAGSTENKDFTVWQTVGSPNAADGKEDAKAWTITDKSKTVIVRFDKSVNASEVRVKQNLNPGSIVKVELIDDKGKSHTVFEGLDRNDYSKSSSFFIASFSETSYKTNTIRITTDPDAIQGTKQIDAIQLVGK